MNIAVFASGRGTNLQAIIDAVKRGRIKANLALVVSDNKNAYALKRAGRAKIKTLVIDARNFKTRQDFDQEVSRHLEQERIDLIILAGFMRILSPWFVSKYKNRILNIHPALLPSFKGAHAIQDAFNCGVKITGVTVHFVDKLTDHGPIILQGELKLKEADTLKSLEARIHKLEHKLYPEAIRLFTQGRIKIKGRRVKIV